MFYLYSYNHGIIPFTKLRYRKKINKRGIILFDKNVSFEMTILDASTLLRSACEVITTKVIWKSFRCFVSIFEENIDVDEGNLGKTYNFVVEIWRQIGSPSWFEELVPLSNDYVYMDDDIFNITKIEWLCCH